MRTLFVTHILHLWNLVNPFPFLHKLEDDDNSTLHSKRKVRCVILFGNLIDSPLYISRNKKIENAFPSFAHFVISSAFQIVNQIFSSGINGWSVCKRKRVQWLYSEQKDLGLIITHREFCQLFVIFLWSSKILNFFLYSYFYLFFSLFPLSFLFHSYTKKNFQILPLTWYHRVINLFPLPPLVFKLSSPRIVSFFFFFFFSLSSW